MAKIKNYLEGTREEMLAMAGNFKGCRVYEGENDVWHIKINCTKIKNVGKGKLSTKAKVDKAITDEPAKIAAREAKKAEKKAAKKEAKQ